MQYLRNYSYPFFLSMSGILATISDVLQSLLISYFVVAILVLAAATALVAERVRPLNAAILGNLPDDIRGKFSNTPFAVSCVVLAIMVGAFSSLSAQAADEGGLIASNYPEIRDLQVRLGVLQETSDRIELKADRLLDATHQWISITDFRLWNNSQSKDVHIRLENNTPFVFKNARGVIETSDKTRHKFGGLTLASDAIHWDNLPNGAKVPDRMSVCLIAERTRDGVSFREIRTYKVGKGDSVSFDYLLEDVLGPIEVADGDGCDNAVALK